MSLVVWLPLTKDLRNQGLSNVTVTNNGSTFNSAGKLGGCYEFASGKRIQTTLPPTSNLNSKAISFACWVNISSWNSSYDCLMSIADGTGWQQSRATLCRNNTASTLCWNIADGSTSTRVYTTTSLSTNTWYHIACTYDGTSLKIYVNGTLNNSAAATLSIGYAGTFNIGGWSGNNYPINCKMNDVRVYSHCLSPMEVKELAKGLVLHYPLNRGGWGQENLMPNTIEMQLGNSNTSTGTWRLAGSNTMTRERVAISDSPIGPCYGFQNSGTQTGSDTSCYGMDSFVLDTSSVYTISFFARTINGGEAYAGFFAYDISSWGAGNYTDLKTSAPYYSRKLTNQWQRIWVSFTTNTVAARSIYLGISTGTSSVITQMCGVKIEKGNVPTPWSPKSTDSLATLMDINTNIEYDCSGFCNNGTKWAYDNAGTISYTSNTPKYSISTFLDSANNTTNTASGTQYIYGDCTLTTPQYLTVAFWCKPIAGYGNNTGQGQFSLTINNIGSDAGSDYQSGPMNHRDGIVDVNGSNGTTHKTVSINFTANEWHHYAIVYDGRYARVYKDGIATATADMGSTMTLGSMKGAVIGFSKAGGVWRSNKSYYSDFRIYATALSADDVKSLYQNSAYIDSSGNVYGAVHSEV